MADKNQPVVDPTIEPSSGGVTRRRFVGLAGGVGAAAVVGGSLIGRLALPDHVVALPASEGYLLVDTRKCATCASCMLACSMAHSGSSNLSLSRIQVLNDPLGKFPDDVQQKQCRQCVDPKCVEACPTGANHVSEKFGGVRMVDEDKCIGCERCVYACPFTPSRMQWNHIDRTAQKCDLCANTPYWETEGGPGGKQLCVEVCPHNALSYQREVPEQEGDSEYDVNLRADDAWGQLGFPIDDAGEKLMERELGAGSY